MARFGAASASWVSMIVATALIGGVAYLFFRAARGLSGNGRSISRWGWIALATVTFLAPQVFRAYVIPTGAMEDTILIGDQLLVRVLGTSTPSCGDVIVFRYPVDMRQTFVKRCMGVPGDRIKLVNKQVSSTARNWTSRTFTTRPNTSSPTATISRAMPTCTFPTLGRTCWSTMW